MKRIFASSEEVRTRLLEVTQNEAVTTVQIAGRHRLYRTEERLVRWLLMVHDRVSTTC